MATLATLRKEAKALGIPASEIRGATSVEELQTVIDGFGKPATTKRVVKKKAAVKKSTPARKSAAKASPATSTKGTAKRTPARKSKATKKAATGGYVPKGGRNVLDGVDFTNDEGWNARENSAPARIIKALRTAKGNRERAFDKLVDQVWDFVGRKKRDGSKRTKADAEAMLRYRISRTAWDFALRTGQHDKATNRVEYGTGGTGNGTWKPAKRKATSSRKSTAKKSARKPAARKSTARKSGRSTKR